MNSLRLEGASDEPLYNIGIVSRMTGIPVATLRVWERRYGFPNTTRTPGGHRLCSEKEVLRLRWVKARVDEGMQTGQAVRALQHLEHDGRVSETPSVTARALGPVNDPSLPLFRARLVEALINTDVQAADRDLGDILTLYPLEELILEVVGPALHDIGAAWLAGRISVATEHLATNFLRQHLLMWMSIGPVPYAGVAPIVLACGPGEWHEGSLLMMGVLLRRRRWPVAYLGQNVPLADLGALVKQMKAPALVLVATLQEPVKDLLSWPEHLPDAARTGRPIVCYGGPAFTGNPDWREQMPGVFLGDSLREGIEKLDDLLLSALGPVG